MGAAEKARGRISSGVSSVVNTRHKKNGSGTSPTRSDLPTVTALYDKAFEHVRLMSHTNIYQCDDITGRRLGLRCKECEIQWYAPFSGPGQYTHWPYGIRNPSTVAGRRDYLLKGIARATPRSALEIAFHGLKNVITHAWDIFTEPESEAEVEARMHQHAQANFRPSRDYTQVGKPLHKPAGDSAVAAAYHAQNPNPHTTQDSQAHVSNYKKVEGYTPEVSIQLRPQVGQVWMYRALFPIAIIELYIFTKVEGNTAEAVHISGQRRHGLQEHACQRGCIGEHGSRPRRWGNLH